MARKRLLTWRKADGRFVKIIDGRAHYFGRAKSVDDTKAYREAEQRYLQFLSERERHAPVAVRASAATLAQVAERFLQSLEERCERGEISVSYFIRSRKCLNDFVAALGQARRFASISELALEEFKSDTLRLPVSEVTGRPISIATAKNRLDAVKALYRWAYKNRIVNDSPRNLIDYTSFSLPQPTVKVFTVAEVRRLWDAAPERTRAFIALGLNCGFGQSDISELRVREVNLDARCVEHSRAKTGVQSRHRLWPVTAGLLTRFRRGAAGPEDPWFLTESGGPLVREWLEDGKLKKVDAVKNAFWRLLNATGINGGRGFYTLRKTGASEIERIDPLVTSLYLAHSPREMKRFYALRNWAALDAALDELGRRFDLPIGGAASPK